MNDELHDFFEFDVTMGSDEVTCPHCGAKVSCSLFMGDEVVCPKCGETIKKDG